MPQDVQRHAVTYEPITADVPSVLPSSTATIRYTIDSLRNAASIRSKSGPRFNSSLKMGNTIVSTPACALAVFAVALAVLAWGIESAGVAAPYSDPIAHIRAQDEAFYVNSAIRMTEDGDWLTPKVMGRFFLFKPPLLMWMAALCIRVLGLSLTAVRLPSLLLGAVGAAAVFAWAVHARSRTAGVLAAGLLVLSPFWQMLSRLCYTDVTGSAFVILALLPAVFDPRMQRRRTPLAAGAFAAAAILTKSVAGLIPLAALGLYWVVMPRGRGPRFRSLILAGLTTAAVLAPWHLYQAAVHTKWFWADYVQVQLLGIGLTAARNGIFDRPALFYLERLVRMDPVPAMLIVVSFAGIFRVSRSRQNPPAVLAVCWAVVTALALAAFQAKNLPYLAFLVPPLCVLGAVSSPEWLLHRPAVPVALLGVLFAVKLAAAGAPWSLHPLETPVEGARAMRAYYQMNRDAELLDCAPDDEFYSSLIPLKRVRYCFVDPSGQVGRIIPHYPFLGIVLTADQFVGLPELMPGFRTRLAAWGMNSTEPVGTSITLRTPSDLVSILHARPDIDAYVPVEWDEVAKAVAASHWFEQFSDSRAFLLSRTAHVRPGPPRPIPARW